MCQNSGTSLFFILDTGCFSAAVVGIKSFLVLTKDDENKKRSTLWVTLF